MLTWLGKDKRDLVSLYFQGSFSYYIKREYYIQKPEIVKEKKALKINLEKRNKAIKAENKKK